MELSEISVSENKLGEETVIKKSKDAENKVKEHPYVNSSFVADIDTYVQGRCENHVYEHLQRADDSAASCKRGCIARFKQYKGFMMLSLIGLVFIVAVTALAISIIGLREKTVMGERGIWNDWEPWGDCSATCSYGMERRERKCSASIGKQCYGDSSEYRICNKMLCPVYVAKGDEPHCSKFDFEEKVLEKMVRIEFEMERLKLEMQKSIETVNKINTHVETNVDIFSKKQGEINDQIGQLESFKNNLSEEVKRELHTDLTNFKDQSFPKVDGGWSSWGSWSECSASCGTGMASRNRSCSNPKPSNGGDHCFGDSTEYQSCNKLSCPGKAVGFTAVYPVQGTGTSSSPLKFNSVSFNSNNIFNMSTGEFVCQQSGLYLFIFTLLRSTGTTEMALCRFYKNGSPSNYALAIASDKNTNTYPTGAASYLQYLQYGDRVYLSGCYNSNNFQGETYFTGCLIQAEN